jgi:hypothetical protein
MNGEQMMAQFEEANIDPVKYGQLWEKVQNYERRFDDMEKKIDKMEGNLEKLVALANQGRGGFWVGMSIVSAASAAAGYIMSYFGKH